MNDNLRACLWGDFDHEHKWRIHFSEHKKIYTYTNTANAIALSHKITRI